ncbi:MAG TPA: branched-chain amino acid ABC transporter permease [Acidimicrobiales bacterium]|nr:branched-chain amino acid ABC transporter permease [Acidimicrobiales bacterium]
MATEALPAVAEPPDLGEAARFWGPRYGVWALIVAVVVAVGLLGPNAAQHGVVAAAYVIVGLSLNIILGYTGQLSLGHQGFVGAGALFAAYSATKVGLPFGPALVIGVAAGAAFALLLGFVALRIRGLYLALITLVFGLALQVSLFQAPSLTNGGAGQPANRPSSLLAPDRYYFVCLGITLLVMYLDYRLTKSKAGRAFITIRDDERVASAFGINVTAYKLLAFVLCGATAGLAGGLLAFASQQFNGNSYTFQLALTFVLMTVVGGVGSRSGVVVGSVLFALLHDFLATFHPFISLTHVLPGQLSTNAQQFGPDLIGALLLLVTLAVNPGGIHAGIAPLMSWLRGGDFTRADDGPASHGEGPSGRP